MAKKSSERGLGRGLSALMLKNKNPKQRRLRLRKVPLKKRLSQHLRLSQSLFQLINAA